MFKVIDGTSYEIYKDLELEQVTRWGEKEWKCLTKAGYYLNIKMKGGTLYADLAETENELGFNAMPLIKYEYKNVKDWAGKQNKVAFEEIKKVMNWTCVSDQIWDIV